MGVETATYISQLSSTNPLGTDPISEGDNQIRLVKDVLQKQFPNFTAATVDPTCVELNYNNIATLGTSENSKCVTQSAAGAIIIGATSGDQTIDIASHDLVDGGLKLAGTLVTASATEVNLLDGKTVVGDAVLDTAQNWTKGQRGEITALTSATSITIDMADSNNFSVTLAHNATFENPSNDVAGQSGSIFITQDASGSRTGAWGTDWEFAGGVAPTLTTTAAAVDRVDYVIKSTTSIQAVATLNLS